MSSRRAWRLGGGFIKYTAKSTISYDGDSRVRRVTTASTQKGATAPELTTSKWGETQSFSKVIDFADGRMVLLPSGCWIIGTSVQCAQSVPSSALCARRLEFDNPDDCC